MCRSQVVVEAGKLDFLSLFDILCAKILPFEVVVFSKQSTTMDEKNRHRSRILFTRGLHLFFWGGEEEILSQSIGRCNKAITNLESLCGRSPEQRAGLSLTFGRGRDNRSGRTRWILNFVRQCGRPRLARLVCPTRSNRIGLGCVTRHNFLCLRHQVILLLCLIS